MFPTNLAMVGSLFPDTSKNHILVLHTRINIPTYPMTFPKITIFWGSSDGWPRSSLLHLSTLRGALWSPLWRLGTLHRPPNHEVFRVSARKRRWFVAKNPYGMRPSGPPVELAFGCLKKVAELTLVYGRYNYSTIVDRVYKPTYNWGAPSCHISMGYMNGNHMGSIAIYNRL